MKRYLFTLLVVLAGCNSSPPSGTVLVEPVSGCEYIYARGVLDRRVDSSNHAVCNPKTPASAVNSNHG